MNAQSERGAAYIRSIANIAVKYVHKHRSMTATVVVASAATAMAIPYLSASTPNTLRSAPASQVTSGQAEPIQDNPNVGQKDDAIEQGTAANDAQSQTSITVNGQKVETPPNASYSKTIDDGASHTTINVNTRNSSTGSSTSLQSSSSSSIQTQLRSETTTTTSTSD